MARIVCREKTVGHQHKNGQGEHIVGGPRIPLFGLLVKETYGGGGYHTIQPVRKAKGGEVVRWACSLRVVVLKLQSG